MTIQIVLSDKDLRKKYNQFGKDQAVPEAGFEDPSELISTIFGGEAFYDLYVFHFLFVLLYIPHNVTITH